MASPPSIWDIDRALAERNFDYLCELIRQDLAEDVRAHLAGVFQRVLTRKIKFPPHRPKRFQTHSQAVEIGNRVHELKWKLVKKPYAVVAAEFGCSISKVEQVYAAHKKALKEYQREKYEYDFLLDMAHEARAEAALEYLQEEHGEREYSDEEIEIAAQHLDDTRDHDDY